MKGTKAEITVGLFALIVLAILSYMTFKVGEFQFLERDGYTVYADFRDTAGLDVKTKVKMAGVDAGLVDSITLVGGKARVMVRMNPGIVLYSDASARIKSSGLLGDKYLDIRPGSTEPTLGDGDEIKNISEVADIDDLVRNLTDISQRMVEFIEDINQKELRDALKETLLNLRDITTNLGSVVSENKQNFTQIMNRLNSITAKVDEFIDENKDPLTRSVQNVEKFSSSLREKGPDVLDNLNKASTELKALLEEAGPELKSMATKANTTMETIASISNKVDKGEGTLGKLVQDEELYTSLTNAAKGLDRTLASVERFRTFVTFRDDYLFESDEHKGAFYLTLQPREDKYYVIGVVKDPLGSVRVTKTRTNGGFEREEKIFEDKIEFTAHFAKRYSDTALRIGMTESSFGLGFDQFMLDDRLKLSVDGWDFNDREEFADKPHLRLAADYYVFKNFFVSGGVDNLLNSDLRGAFIGGGLTFEDEDLKYLLGPASDVAGR